MKHYNILINLINLGKLYKLYKLHIKRRYNRRCSVQQIFQERKSQGDYLNLVREMKFKDPGKYFNYLRVTTTQFDELLNLVGPEIKKCYDTKEPLSPGERLTITLRYLASGDSMTSMSYSFRIGKSTVSLVVLEICNAIWETLHEQVSAQPNENSWVNIAKDFQNLWQLPHGIGAIDGKHCVIQAPPNSGSDFYNYKNTFGIILLAVCDARYKFSMIDIGAKGRQSDGGVLRNSKIERCLQNKQLNTPQPTPLEEDGESIPYYIVGDEAFPLKENLLRPFPGKFLNIKKRIFNYRLSRGRRVIENSFGILVARWRIYRKPFMTCLKATEAIIKATLCLHNFLMAKNETNTFYCPSNFTDTEISDGMVIPGLWRQELESRNCNTCHFGSNTYTENAAENRENLALYFMSEGAVDFQWNKV